MWFGAHLPLIGIDGSEPVSPARFVKAARDAGISAISASDHLVFPRPWLDGLVALSSVIERSGDMTLAMTTTLPVLRGPAAVAKAAATLDALSGGRFVLGVSPGYLPADYAAAGIPFAQRWSRFDESVRVLRAALSPTGPPQPGRFYDVPVLEPRPQHPVPIWIGSWGSPAGLRRAAALGDGWLVAAAHTSPDRITAGRVIIDATRRGHDEQGFPITLAGMWTFITESASAAQTQHDAVAHLLGDDPATLAGQVLIGSAQACAETLTAYAEAGVDGVLIWPVADPLDQLRRFAATVVPRL
ncbi:LLM class flavin-dependent oxidoreductase [Gordonia sp. NPDC003424]